MSEKEKRIKEEEDIEELKEVFGAISAFLKDLAPTISEIMSSIIGSLDGAKLGEEAGKFYKGLVDAGIDPKEATRLTEKFVEQKLAIIQLLPQIIKPKLMKNKEIIRKERENEE
ncbi:MAG: hypothetical protein J7K23_03470 [Thermoproteales archaeon]|nr:hypothetical protein [Thermoproteales archaeon]